MKRPAFQFYPADWRKDVELRSCSIAARGLWIDVLCLAHECEPYGHLTVNGRPMTAAQIAGQVGLATAQCQKLLAELIDNGVARKTPEGVIYSKRMVEDEDLRTRRAEGGKAGSEHGIKGAEHGSKGGRPPKGRGVSKPPLDRPLEPPPSSSSSSSEGISVGAKAPTSSAEPTEATAGQKPKPATAIPCPYQRIVDLYHEALPSLPGVRLMDEGRKKAMRSFWGWVLSSKKPGGERRAVDADAALCWIAEYFGRAGENDFLMGRLQQPGKHQHWRADLDFLLTQKGMRHVIEKTVEHAA